MISLLLITVYIGLTLLACETCQSFEFERRRLWGARLSINSLCIRFIYCYLRYISIPYLLIAFGLHSASESHNYSHSACARIYEFEAYSLQTFLVSFEVLIAFRVYATFNKNKYIAYLLAIIITFSTILNVVIPIKTAMMAEYDSHCQLINHPIGLGWLAFTILSSQGALALLQFIGILKLYRENSRRDLERTPVPVLLREHGVAFVVFIVYIVFAIVFFERFVYLGYYILMGLVPILGCRLVLHLHGFRDGFPYDDETRSTHEEIDIRSRTGRFTTCAPGNVTEIRACGLELSSFSESSSQPRSEDAAAQQC